MQTVSILPAAGGWVVQAPEIAEQFFAKGSAAETAAWKLATALALTEHVEIAIFLRDGSLARRFVVPPESVAA